MTEVADVFRQPSERFWSRAYYTPVSDAWRGQLTARLDLRRQIAAHNLPEKAAGLVYDVARRTRLSRWEKVDVATELAAHFADGLAAGAPLERLFDQFGPPRVAARLIRRAKLRQRSLLARLARGSILTVAGVLMGLLILYLLLFLRFSLARPSIAHDYWRDANALRHAPPGEATAWPLYVQIEAALKESLNGEQRGWIWEGPAGEHGSEVAELVRANRAAVDSIHRAAACRYFGMLFEPQGPAAQQANPSLFITATTDVQDIHILPQLVIVDAWVAADDEDAARVMADLVCLFAMAEHFRPEQPTSVEQIVASGLSRRAFALIGQLAVDHPQLFSDEQLRDLAHRVARQFGGGRLLADHSFDRWLLLDLLQRTFTDDGRGGGLMTAEGFRLLEQVAGSRRSPFPFADEERGFELVGPAASLAVANRREQLRVAEKCFALADESIALPPWQWKEDSAWKYYQCLVSNPFGGLLFFPISHVCPLSNVQTFLERWTQERDATLVVLALVLYHRHHNEWPQTLDLLTPGLLPEVPPDRCDGQPIRYVIRDGQPLIYSIGGDFRDDGGHPPAKHEATQFIDYFDREAILSGKRKVFAGWQGDWVLWPPPQPAEE